MRPAPALRSGGRLWWSLGSCRCCTWRWARSVWRSRSSACSSHYRCSDRPEPETQEEAAVWLDLRLWSRAVNQSRAVCVWACTWLTALACWACTVSLNCSRAWNWLFLVNVMIFSTEPNLLKIWKQTRTKRVDVDSSEKSVYLRGKTRMTEHFYFTDHWGKKPLKSVCGSELCVWKQRQRNMVRTHFN